MNHASFIDYTASIGFTCFLQNSHNNLDEPRTPGDRSLLFSFVPPPNSVSTSPGHLLRLAKHRPVKFCNFVPLRRGQKYSTNFLFDCMIGRFRRLLAISVSTYTFILDNSTSRHTRDNITRYWNTSKYLFMLLNITLTKYSPLSRKRKIGVCS